MLLIKIGTITINTFLPTRNTFVYSSSIKIRASVFNKLLESIFCLLLVVEAYSLQNVIKMLEEVVVSWWEVRWIWQMRQNFIAWFIQLLKCWLWDACGWALLQRRIWPFLLTSASCRRCSFWCISLICWVYFLDIMGFFCIQKAVVDQTGGRPPAVTMTFLWCKFGFGKCFVASSWSNHWPVDKIQIRNSLHLHHPHH